MKYPGIHHIESLIKHANETTTYDKESGTWTPARPEGYPSFWYRVLAAWLVFIGRADALKWKGQ